MSHPNAQPLFDEETLDTLSELWNSDKTPYIPEQVRASNNPTVQSMIAAGYITFNEDTLPEVPGGPR